MKTKHPEITDAQERVPTAMMMAMAVFTLASSSFAGPRTSANYSITTDTTDNGGARATSAAYTNDASAGSVAGLSTVASPGETVKSGYIGQLYEITALQLNASPLTINESGTRQLSAWQLLDDATFFSVQASSVSWSVLSGPVTSISSTGLATAGTIAQDTAAQVQGTFAGLAGTLNLTVLDTIKDNFGTYANDSIDDAWQTQYFGANNPNAAPNAISDGSGLTNLFKYTAGLVPNNAASRFNFNTQAVTGQPGQRTLSFSPALPDRQYTILYSTDLSTWQTLSGPFAGNGTTFSYTDTNAGGPRKFYRIQIVKP